MQEQINAVSEGFAKRFAAYASLAELEQLRIEYFGKKGLATGLLKSMGSLPPEQRKATGESINAFRVQAQKELEAKIESLKNEQLEQKMLTEWLDSSIDSSRHTSGSLHPVSLVRYQLEDVFSSMGFTILDGPHVETEHYNFEALNIAADHPARDMQDTFFLDNGQLLRTQTSTIQIRGMEAHPAPFRFIGAGKVFRAERTDASHDAVFHQLEGMLVDKGISVAHLIYFMRVMLQQVLEDDSITIRLRPGYFPFVEPGFELDIACQICNASTRSTCKACKGVGWLELIGCGMTHPKVLQGGGVDTDVYSGFAFGVGLDRLAMMKYGISDIRLLHSGDVRFARQFSEVPNSGSASSAEHSRASMGST